MCDQCKILEEQLQYEQEQRRLIQDRYIDAVAVIDAHRKSLNIFKRAVQRLTGVIERGEHISAARLDYRQIGKLGGE